MIRQGILFLLIALVTTGAFAQNTTAPVIVEAPPPAKKSALGAVLTIGLITVAAGAGGYLYYRREMSERARADSIIKFVESQWNQAGVLYSKEQYRPALENLQKISAVWYSYEKYIKKYRKKSHVDPDTIKMVIASCDFLEQMIQPIRQLRKKAMTLPKDEFGMMKISRREVAFRQADLRSSMDSLLSDNPNNRGALIYSFRYIERRLKKADSLTRAVYPQQQSDFNVKNRFYYNQAIASNDTGELRRFVEDCEYFNVEKEWCHRARIALQGDKNETGKSMFPPGEASVKDSINFAFEKVLHSPRLEDLEAYAVKYSSAKYRKFARSIRMNEIQAALRQLKERITLQIAFNKAYPRVSVVQPGTISVTVKGLSNTTENAYLATWREMENEVQHLPLVRCPAELSIDYTRDPPLILVDAIIDPATDVNISEINGRAAYRIECLVPVISLLHALKTATKSKLQKSDISTGDIIDYEVKKVNFAVYAVRLHKPDKSGMLMFYARQKKEVDTDTSRTFDFYDFYDIAASGYSTKRFPIYPTSLPNIIPSLSSDTLEQVMGGLYFSAQTSSK